MSETIAIEIAEAPDFIGTLDAVSAALHINDLRCLEDVPPPGTPWPDGIWHLFRHDVSTRTTEITCGGGEFPGGESSRKDPRDADARSSRSARFAIRMFSMASREDVALAVALAEYVAVHAGVTEVSSEQRGMIPPSELAGYYTADWADSQIESGHRVVAAMVRDDKGPMEIPGPNRSFIVGPRVLLQLGPEAPAQKLLEAVRRVQWIPIRTAGQFTAHAKTDNREIKLAMWLGDEVVFPGVEFAGVSDPNGEKREVFLIPSSRIADLAGERWTPIDEKQGILADFGDDWPAVVAAARKFEVTP